MADGCAGGTRHMDQRAGQVSCARSSPFAAPSREAIASAGSGASRAVGVRRPAAGALPPLQDRFQVGERADRRLRPECAGAGAVDQQRRDAGPPRTVYVPARERRRRTGNPRRGRRSGSALRGTAGGLVCGIPPRRRTRPGRSARQVRAAPAPHATPAAGCPGALERMSIR